MSPYESFCRVLFLDLTPYHGKDFILWRWKGVRSLEERVVCQQELTSVPNTYGQG